MAITIKALINRPMAALLARMRYGLTNLEKVGNKVATKIRIIEIIFDLDEC